MSRATFVVGRAPSHRWALVEFFSDSGRTVPAAVFLLSAPSATDDTAVTSLRSDSGGYFEKVLGPDGVSTLYVRYTDRTSGATATATLSASAAGDPVGVNLSSVVAKAGDTMTGDLAMSGHRVTGLADPSAGQDAATRAYVLTQIASLVNSAPGLLDTLGEIAAQLQSDESAAAALATTVASKAATTYVDAQVAATLTTATGRAAAFALVLGG